MRAEYQIMRHMSGVGPEFKKGDGRLRPIAPTCNNASPAEARAASGGMLNRSPPRRSRRSYSQLRCEGHTSNNIDSRERFFAIPNNSNVF